ncbi:MAG: uroporphyrinogen decarboxylase family protein [Firmicutes bacterium]|nr:uroporphyrinogen decarboxylase family protein [Bacillota bacterium]
MTSKTWEHFKRAALSVRRGGEDEGDRVSLDSPPVALIVDSPWLPGFAGISHFDYFTLPEVWLDINLRLGSLFPEVVFLPGFWVEYGMATEPSAFGCRITWWENSPPSVNPMLHDISEVSRLRVPNPREDGLMPFVLNLYRHVEKRLKEKGDGACIKMVAARGPLALAAHLRGTTELMIDLKLYPDGVKKLLEITTETVVRWLRAQIENLSEVEGIMVLDDIVGFLSPADYMEFAHPYLKQIFSSFGEMIKVYHNDANIGAILENLAETGLDVLNFTHRLDIGEARQRVGHKIALMGNVPPLEVLVQGTPEEVKACAIDCLRKTGGGRGLLLSAGGGVSPGTPAENIRALVEAAEACLS